jgi:NifU-like protein
MSVGQQIAESLVCHCYGITETQVRRSIDAVGARSVEDVIVTTCAGGGCTACHFRIRRILRDATGVYETPLYGERSECA